MSKIYKTSAFNIISSILSGEDPANFIEAEFSMFEQNSATPFLVKNLASGVSVENGKFKISITDTDINVIGTVYYQFILTNSSGEKLPPLYTGTLNIKEVK